MATNKKTKKKRPSPKRTAAKSKSRSLAKKTAKKKPSKKKLITKKNAAPAKKAVKKALPVEKAEKTPRTFSRQAGRARSGGQSGDLQGLSDIGRTDAESVDELLEEGNAFEADVVAGVERADDEDEQEVHTHEVPEDDVPEEYLDKE